MLFTFYLTDSILHHDKLLPHKFMNTKNIRTGPEWPHLLLQIIPRYPESTLLSTELRAASYGSEEGHYRSPLLSEGVSESLEHLVNQTQLQSLYNNTKKYTPVNVFFLQFLCSALTRYFSM